MNKALEEAFDIVEDNVRKLAFFLGRALGLNEPTINEVFLDNRDYGAREITHKILYKWYGIVGSEASIKKLATALLQVGNVQTADIIYPEFTEEEKQAVKETHLNNLKERVLSVSLNLGFDDARHLAQKLDLKDDTIKNLTNQYERYGHEEVSYQLLMKWIKSKGTDATNEKLYDVLVRIGRSDEAQRIFPGFHESVSTGNQTSMATCSGPSVTKSTQGSLSKDDYTAASTSQARITDDWVHKNDTQATESIANSTGSDQSSNFGHFGVENANVLTQRATGTIPKRYNLESQKVRNPQEENEPYEIDENETDENEEETQEIADNEKEANDEKNSTQSVFVKIKDALPWRIIASVALASCILLLKRDGYDDSHSFMENIRTFMELFKSP